jgi:thioredoxin 1
MNQVTQVNQDDFQKVVLESTAPVLVNFTSGLKKPFQFMNPMLETIAQSLDGMVKFVKVEISENEALAKQFDIEYVPTLVIFEGGKETDRLLGFGEAI